MPASAKPSRIENAGTARMPSTHRGGDAVADRLGDDHAAPPTARTRLSGRSAGCGRTNGTRRLFTRCLTMPSSAGSRVTAATIVTATISAEPQPIIDIIGMPATCRPRIAMITVSPANSTDWPAVALARPIATGHRHARREVLAVPGQDEQGVVDPHTEPEHQADDAGDGRHGEEPDRRPMALLPTTIPIEGSGDGQAHGHQRAEREERAR